MTGTNQWVSLKHAVEQELSERAENEVGFVERVALDPAGVVEPIIADLLDDDGELDLSKLKINVHVQTPNQVHFVLAAGVPETSGYVLGSGFGDLLGLAVPLRGKDGGGTSSGGTTVPEKTKYSDDARCHTDKSATGCARCNPPLPVTPKLW